MVDASACVGMEIDAPRASMAALPDLDDLLKQRGLRRCSSSDIAGEEQPDAEPKEQADFANVAVDATRLDAAAGDEFARS